MGPFRKVTPVEIETPKELSEEPSEGGTNEETCDLLVRSGHCVSETWWLCSFVALPLDYGALLVSEPWLAS